MPITEVELLLALDISTIIKETIMSSTNIYTSPLCSCIICREVKSAKGIHSHYITKHTEEGNKRVTVNAAIGSIKAAMLATEKAKSNNDELKISYKSNPRICPICSNIIPFDKRNNKTCSKSCSATYANNKRALSGWTQSTETKNKISNKITGRKLKPEYCKVNFCIICNAVIRNSHRATCGDNCLHILASNNSKDLIIRRKKSNYSRWNGPSRMERSFSVWLNNNGIYDFEVEKPFVIPITNKLYFGDFYFPKLKLLIELDGKQHEKEEAKIYDKTRDSLLKEHFDIETVRITQHEYDSGSRIEEISLLVGLLGTAPSSAV
jgi:very-short-patch-repair endonuclease